MTRAINKGRQMHTDFYLVQGSPEFHIPELSLKEFIQKQQQKVCNSAHADMKNQVYIQFVCQDGEYVKQKDRKLKL